MQVWITIAILGATGTTVTSGMVITDHTSVSIGILITTISVVVTVMGAGGALMVKMGKLIAKLDASNDSIGHLSRVVATVAEDVHDLQKSNARKWLRNETRLARLEAVGDIESPEDTG